MVTLSLGNDPWEWAIPRGGVELMVKKTSLVHGIRLRPDYHLFHSLITIIFGSTAHLRLRLPLYWAIFLDHAHFSNRHTHTHIHIHTVGLLWTTDQLIAVGATYTTQQTQQANIYVLSGIRTRNPSYRATADLRLRLRGHRIGKLVTTLPVNSDVLVPKEKQDGISACFIFVMDFSFIAFIHNAVNKIKRVMKSVLSSESSVQLYQNARCTGLERNIQWSGRWMDSEAQWFNSSQRKDFVLHNFRTSSGDRQASYWMKGCRGLLFRV